MSASKLKDLVSNATVQKLEKKMNDLLSETKKTNKLLKEIKDILGKYGDLI